MTKKWITKKIQFEREIIDVVRNSYIKDDIFRSDFLRSFIQFQHHNITSDKWSDQNNATLLFVHFNFIIQFRKMFLFLKSIHIAQYIKSNLRFVYWVLLCFVFFVFCFFVFFCLKICIIIQWYVRSVFWKKCRSVLFITWLCRSAVRN